MPGQAPDAPDRVTNSHREASAPSSPRYEADKVALEQLEGTKITRKGDPSSLYTHLKWWLQEDNVLQGQPLHPLICSSILTELLHQEGWGSHLGEHTARGTMVPSRSKLHIELSGTKMVIGPFKNTKTSG